MQATIRHDVYCSQLFLIDVVMRGLVVPHLTLLRDFNCVREYPATGYPSPADIIHSIKEWHKKMVRVFPPLSSSLELSSPPPLLVGLQIDHHRGCCEVENRTFSRLLDDLYGRTYFTAGELASDCPLTYGQSLRAWDLQLSHIAWLVRMLELMEGLGRRRKCLRGCVSEGQVRCTNLISPILS